MDEAIRKDVRGNGEEQVKNHGREKKVKAVNDKVTFDQFNRALDAERDKCHPSNFSDDGWYFNNIIRQLRTITKFLAGHKNIVVGSTVSARKNRLGHTEYVGVAIGFEKSLFSGDITLSTAKDKIKMNVLKFGDNSVVLAVYADNEKTRDERFTKTARVNHHSISLLPGDRGRLFETIKDGCFFTSCDG